MILKFNKIHSKIRTVKIGHSSFIRVKLKTYSIYLHTLYK
jgi:hypothetical protein